MSRVYFFSDDFYFLTGMKESCKERFIKYSLITTIDKTHIIEEKVNTSRYDDVFVFSFENKYLLSEVLKKDRGRTFRFIIIINTPLSTKNISIGNWLVMSKFDSFIEMNLAMSVQTDYQPSDRVFLFTAREEYIWSLLRRGNYIHEIARYLKLSPKTVYAARVNILRKIGFKRKNELIYLKYGNIFHSQ